ncbi:hypothetical protein [Marinifilum flexuosum]|uniref:hypothetical protein n=1 Tax=Marinifilum flexuosum TaxID=1117708 RepID=UPI00249466BA|nr:hypothetical protein [Marinifilum flexuosum]
MRLEDAFYISNNQLDRFYRSMRLSGEIVTDTVISNQCCLKLIVRFNTNSCDLCQDIVFTYLKEYSKIIGRDNILFFGTFNNENEIQQYRNRLDQLGTVYNISKGQIVNDIESMNTPYLFVIDEFNRYVNVFIPEKNNHHILKDYLDSVVKIL